MNFKVMELGYITSLYYALSFLILVRMKNKVQFILQSICAQYLK